MNESILLKGLPFVDSFFPAGGYAYSYGLEAAVQEGAISTGDGLKDYLAYLLRFGAGRSDAIAAAVAHRAVMKGQIDMAVFADRRLDAMKVCSTLREGSRQMGWQVIRIGGELMGQAIILEMLHLMECGKTPCHYPVATGMVLAACGWSEREMLVAYLYQAIVGCVSAALRLLPVGQREGQRLIHSLLPCVLQIVKKVEGLGIEDMTCWMPLHEIRAMRHVSLEVRLFRS